MSAESPDPESSAVAVESSRSSRWLARLIGPGDVHWRMALGIVLAALVVLVLLWNKESDDRSAQIIDTYYVTAWTVVLLAVWWLLFSGLNWQTRMYGLGGVIATVAGLLFVFRLDGFTGDFIPMFSRRWARTAEDRAVEYFGSRAPTLTATASSEPLVVTPDDWPQFRGPNRLGISERENSHRLERESAEAALEAPGRAGLVVVRRRRRLGVHPGTARRRRSRRVLRRSIRQTSLGSCRSGAILEHVGG